ncbi:MAG: ABC transporter ATP-binding protein [Bacteroidetes bacterium]|nr:ABC transporter ATP-binding protein [Bacteroidota bacterium]
MKAIEVENLTKIYKSHSRRNDIMALSNLSLSVQKGQIFGLLGPNGAGKTTFIKILLGITHPTLGTGSMLGETIKNYKNKSRVGYLPENHKYPHYLNAEQILKYFARLGGYKSNDLTGRIDHLLKIVNMEKWKKVKIKKYSKGMMQRLGLALSMVNEPEIIFLDEPTDGVDPIGRKEIRDILLKLKSEGKTIFVNSHLLSEVELISDKVAILNKGKLIREGSVEELTTTKQVYQIEIEETPKNTELFNNNNYSLIESNGNKYTFKFDSSESLNTLIDEIRAKKLNLLSVIPKKHSLEEMFINLINDNEKQNL